MIKNFKKLANKNDYCFYNVIFVLPANIMESKAFKSNQFKIRMKIIRACTNLLRFFGSLTVV